MLNRSAAILALAALFTFRVFYGLTMPFWFEDERLVGQAVIGIVGAERSYPGR